MTAHDNAQTRGIRRAGDFTVDWTDTLRELSQFAADMELPTPLMVTFSGDDPAHVSVAVSGPAHAAWFEHFPRSHTARSTVLASWHRSHGYLRSGARVELTCLADVMLPSQVAS